MVGAASSSFIALLSVVGFLACAWLATRVSRLAGVSSLFLEITVGLILGPSVLKLIPREYAECQHSRHIDCRPPPNLAELIAEGRPLGEGLGMIANTQGLCPRQAYGLPDHMQPVGLREASPVSVVEGDENATFELFWENGTEANATADEELDEELDSLLSGSEEHGPSIGHEARRLSTAAKKYSTYEECLVKSCEVEVAHLCQDSPGFFTLVGHAGVLLMFFESGMHFDFEKATQVGPQACAVAALGVVLPLVTGALLTVIYGRPLMPDGVAVGTALAPSSVGLALRLLGEADVLREDFGQAIITAGFVDDLLSILLFKVVFSMRDGFTVLDTIILPIVAVVFMALAMGLAVKFWPKFLNEVVLPKVPAREGISRATAQDEVLYVTMMTVLVAYATATYFMGTHLWGCFAAGMSFTCLDTNHHAHRVWVKQTKRASSWMLRIFFAATVGFAIPVGTFLSFNTFWKGTVMGIGPCLLAKVCCAPFTGSSRWVVGLAMAGRAEFGYLIAQMTYAAGMLDSETFSIALWALLYASVFAPLILRVVLQRYVQELWPEGAEPPAEKDVDEAFRGGPRKAPVEVVVDRS